MSLNLIPHTQTPLADLLHRASFAPLTNVGWIRVTGTDRVRWLNGMATNSIQDLKPGEGCYNFFLNAQGRIQGDATAWMFEDCILLETAADRVPALMAMLDRFIIMDDVELSIPQEQVGLTIAGPDALSLLRDHGYSRLPGEDLHLTEDRTRNLQFLFSYSPVVPTFELWSDPSTIEALLTELALSYRPSTPEALEQLRILSGTPLFGTDIRNSDTAKDLPQETNQTRALHFAKGCYLGQEIVERIRSRGNVHRTFTGFLLAGEQAAAGDILSSQDKSVGELTSVTTISSQLLADSYQLTETSTQIALGYIRREAFDRAASITYPGGIATPTALPFQLSESRA
jgi:aminomethyltransferase